MDLFNKEKIKNLIQNNKEIIEKYVNFYEKVRDDRDKFLWDILDRKSQAESKLAKAEALKEEADTKYNQFLKTIQKILLDTKNEYMAENEKLKKQNIEIKSELKRARNALGGSKTQLAKKIKQNGELEMFNKFLIEILKKHGIKYPTMQQLIDYDQKRKSNFRREEKNEKEKAIIK